jgi:hypothetical protein
VGLMPENTRVTTTHTTGGQAPHQPVLAAGTVRQLRDPVGYPA